VSQFDHNIEQDRWRPENNVERERLEKLRRIRAQGIDPYPHRVERTHTIAEAIADYETAESTMSEGQELKSIPVTVARLDRLPSAKGRMSFAHVGQHRSRANLAEETSSAK
jgi:lysyl-tRNA synthetase class 2